MGNAAGAIIFLWLIAFLFTPFATIAAINLIFGTTIVVTPKIWLAVNVLFLLWGR